MSYPVAVDLVAMNLVLSTASLYLNARIPISSDLEGLLEVDQVDAMAEEEGLVKTV